MSTDNPIAAKLDRLLELTPIPAWEGDHDWPCIENELGIALPAEYKAYADRFPSGKHRRLEVFHPNSPWEGGLVAQVRQYAAMHAGFDDDHTFYPKPGGLIPWAQFDRDLALCWLPGDMLPGDSDPDLWEVVACGDGKYEEIPGSTLEALVAVLDGEAGHGVFPDFFYDDPLGFLPMDLHVSVKWGLLTPADIGEA